MLRRSAAVLVMAIGLFALSAPPDPLDAQGVVAVAEEAEDVVLESVTLAHDLAVQLVSIERPTCIDFEGHFNVTVTSIAETCDGAHAAVVQSCPTDRPEERWGVQQAFAASGHRFWVTVCPTHFGIVYSQPKPRLVIAPPSDVGRGT